VPHIQKWHHQYLTTGCIERHVLVCTERLSKEYSINKGVVFPGELYTTPGNEGSPHTRQGPPLSVTDLPSPIANCLSVSPLRPCVIFLRSFLQSSIVFGRSSKRVVFLRAFRGLSHERVHGGKDWGINGSVGPITLVYLCHSLITSSGVPFVDV